MTTPPQLRAEDTFVRLFSEVFGLEKSNCSCRELDFTDIQGGPRRIDYAIKTTEGRWLRG